MVRMSKCTARQEKQLKLTPLAFAALLALSSSIAIGAVPGDIYLGSVVGLAPNGGISTNVPGAATFTFNYRNNDPSKAAIVNGFEISGTGGISWIGTYGPDPTFPTSNFDLGWFVDPHSWDGTGADTIGFGGIIFLGDGLPPGFDGPAVVLTIDANGATEGDTICIDSAYYPNSGTWMWGFYGDGSDVPPSWDGPHCYEVVNSTCCYSRGDINHDSELEPDIADLIYLVTFMFQDGPEPPCMAETDINGDGSEAPDIADLIHLVSYLFHEGPAPVQCP